MSVPFGIQRIRRHYQGIQIPALLLFDVGDSAGLFGHSILSVLRWAYVQALSELLEDDTKFGFIIMDGNGTLFGTVSGNAREVLHKMSVEVRSPRAIAALRCAHYNLYLLTVAPLSVTFILFGPLFLKLAAALARSCSLLVFQSSHPFDLLCCAVHMRRYLGKIDWAVPWAK